MTKQVAILGCGPAGMMVAHAAEQCGWDFTIFSRKYQSPLYGAQYLHQPIPGLECGDPKMVRYELRGTPEDYRRKVYGATWDGTVSPEDFMEAHAAWDLRDAYQHMWTKYHERVIDCDFSPAWGAKPALFFGGGFDLFVSTVPRTVWAQDGDTWESQHVWALGDAEQQRVNGDRPDPFTVVCSADIAVPWYRVSNIFGYCTMEWPGMNYNYGRLAAVYANKPGPTPPHEGASLVEKPLRHNITGAKDFVHLGRYGAWEKGILTSDVFYDAMKVFAGDRI